MIKKVLVLILIIGYSIQSVLLDELKKSIKTNEKNLRGDEIENRKQTGEFTIGSKPANLEITDTQSLLSRQKLNGAPFQEAGEKDLNSKAMREKYSGLSGNYDHIKKDDGNKKFRPNNRPTYFAEPHN